jgi:uncharacterized SAM-binding protein YcdF (DUF218 family)
LSLTDSRWFRRVLKWSAALVVFIVAATIAGWPVYVRPQIDSLRPADAIFVLGGPEYERYSFGHQLGDDRWAPVVVVSNPLGDKVKWLADYCATPKPGFQLICVQPDPPTTLGEGRDLRRLAEQYGWKTVIVVTFTPHISRARYILEHCFHGDLVMVAPPTDLSVAEWAWQYVYQTAGYARTVFESSC